MSSRVPVIVILGPTGAEKSKLAIEMARRFGGEILCADSMQVYKGLEILTNKSTAEEQALIPHHFLDKLEPAMRFTVDEFRNEALKIMEDLMEKGKVPVIVGGTNVYIESVLWNTPVAKDKDDTDPHKLPEDGQSDEPNAKRARIESELESLPTDELYSRLQKVDPKRAGFLHPNNRSRIIRSLQVFEQYGKPHSSVLSEQHETEGGSGQGPSLRFPNLCILCLQCEQSVMDERLDNRVDEMMERGLLQELLTFYEKYNQHFLDNNMEPDYIRGIFQSIGFKEFHQYLLMDDSEKNSEQGEKLYKDSVNQLKQAARRYSRKQQRWLKNRFLRRSNRQVPTVYGLDTTNLHQWTKKVFQLAENVVYCTMKGIKPTKITPMSLDNPLVNQSDAHYCDVCTRVLPNSLQWEEHLRSKNHLRKANRKRRY